MLLLLIKWNHVSREIREYNLLQAANRFSLSGIKRSLVISCLPTIVFMQFNTIKGLFIPILQTCMCSDRLWLLPASG